MKNFNNMEKTTKIGKINQYKVNKINYAIQYTLYSQRDDVTKYLNKLYRNVYSVFQSL